MFENTLNLVHTVNESTGATGTPVVTPTVLINWQGQRSFRRSTSGRLLSIGHTQSNENPGFNTQRSVVRVERLHDVPDSDKFVKSVVQIQFSIVKDIVNPYILGSMIHEAANVVVFGSNASASLYISDQFQFDSYRNGIGRLYAGEA